MAQYEFAMVENDRNEANAFGFLLLAICVLIFLMPLAAEQHPQAEILRALITLVLVAGVFASTRTPWVLRTSLFFAVAASSTGWAADILDSQEMALVSYVLALLNILFVIGVVSRVVLRRKQITTDAVFGGLSVFLLIGLSFMIVYGLVEFAQPGSFLVRGETIDAGQSLTRDPASFVQFLYFSLITLSTVGYGDILATRPLAQMLAATEGIVGQLFLAVVVARLVGMNLLDVQATDGSPNE
jgi:hypothetical protein